MVSEHTGLFERFLSSQCFLFASFSPLHSIACLICRRRDENLKPYVLKFEPPQPLKARTQTHHPAVVCAKLSAESLLKTWTKSEGHIHDLFCPAVHENSAVSAGTFPSTASRPSRRQPLLLFSAKVTTTSAISLSTQHQRKCLK